MKKVVLIFLIILILSNPVYAAYADRGDVNFDGVVDIKDVVLIKQHILGIRELDSEEFERADTNMDGVVDIIDLVFVIRVLILEIQDPELDDPTPEEILP